MEYLSEKHLKLGFSMYKEGCYWKLDYAETNILKVKDQDGYLDCTLYIAAFEHGLTIGRIIEANK